MDTKQPDPVAQECADYATSLRSTINVVKLEGRTAPISFLRAADLFERAAARIAELEALRTGYDAARLEIASLQSRVQELGQMARECSDRKVVQLDARVKELEAQLAAIVAGGVKPLRKRECLHQIAEPDHLRGATKMARAVLTNAFLSDVMTAAGLVSHGKQCKALGKRMAAEAMRLRTAEPHLSLRPLLDWQIDAIRIEEELDQWQMKDAAFRYMAREIERAHGITGDEA